MTLLAVVHVLGNRAEWYQKVGWWLFGTVLLVALAVGIFFLFRGIWRAAGKQHR